VSRATAYKWLARYRSEGPAGLADRSSRPQHCPHALPASQVRRVLAARRRRRQGPTGSATTSACPARPSMGAAPPRDEPAGHTDRTSGVAIRYQRERPGELVHLDVKKLGRIPDVAATRSMAAPMPSVAAGSATTMSTRPSMTAPGSPAASSSPTRPGRPRPGPGRGGRLLRRPWGPDRAGADRQRQGLHRLGPVHRDGR